MYLFITQEDDCRLMFSGYGIKIAFMAFLTMVVHNTNIKKIKKRPWSNRPHEDAMSKQYTTVASAVQK